jgi:hypothetical protein
LPVALIFFGKTLAIAKIMCYKRCNFGKSLSLAAFFTKDSSVCPFKHRWRYQTKLVGREVLGACILQARGDTGPLKKLQLHLAMNPSMAAFEAVKAARTPQLWGR